MNRRYRKGMSRRELCRLVGIRAQTLNSDQAGVAWITMARTLEEFGERDVPKFADLLGLIRGVTIVAKKVTR